jgi:hypothetical protein
VDARWAFLSNNVVIRLPRWAVAGTTLTFPWIEQVLTLLTKALDNHVAAGWSIALLRSAYSLNDDRLCPFLSMCTFRDVIQKPNLVVNIFTCCLETSIDTPEADIHFFSECHCDCDFLAI